MNKIENTKSLQEIDHYLSGELDAQQKEEFQKRMTEHKDLEDDVNLTKMVIEGLEGDAFKQMLHKIHRSHLADQSDI